MVELREAFGRRGAYRRMDSTCLPWIRLVLKSHNSQSSSGTNRSNLLSHFLGRRLFNFSRNGSSGRWGGNSCSCRSIGRSACQPNRRR